MKNFMTTCFTNIQLFQPEGFVAGSLTVSGGKIVSQRKKGKLLEGYDADFILFDRSGSLEATYVAGKELLS